MIMVSTTILPQPPQVTSDMKTKNQPKDMFLKVRFQGRGLGTRGSGVDSTRNHIDIKLRCHELGGGLLPTAWLSGFRRYIVLQLLRVTPLMSRWLHEREANNCSSNILGHKPRSMLRQDGPGTVVAPKATVHKTVKTQSPQTLTL